MKRAVALFRKGKILIQGYSKTTTGLWVGMGPVFVGQEDWTDELGMGIREALNRSTEGIPHPSPSEWKKIQAPMLDAAGVRAWVNLAKGAKAVGLEYDGETVKMEPSSNYEKNGGTSIPEQTVCCEFGSSVLGSTLMKAFQACS